MTEEKINATALPQAEENTVEEAEATTPETSENNTFIPVKFNKEIRNLSIDEASVLAQKGLKYESIEKDYNALKELANEDKMSVPVFLSDLARRRTEEKKATLTEKCGGDEALAEHILKLEACADRDNGFAELKENFPHFESADSLPPQVLENSRLKGTLLLDEYLRYLLAEEKIAKAAALKQKTAEKASTGSLTNRKGVHSPETEEFLKGLWK